MKREFDSTPDRHSVFSKLGSQSNRAALLLRREILRRWLGEAVLLPPFEELAKLLDTSRTTINQALRQLQEGGVVYIKRGVGTIVTRPELLRYSDKETINLLQIEKDTRILVARKSAQAERQNTQALHESLEQLEKARLGYGETRQASNKSSLDAYIASVLNFNNAVRLSVEDDQLTLMDWLAEGLNLPLWKAVGQQSNFRDETAGYSKKLVAAIEKRNPEQAMEAVMKHFDNAINVAQQPDTKRLWSSEVRAVSYR